MSEELLGCIGKSCDYAINLANSEIACVSGSGYCGHAYMLSGDSTSAHDADLETASLEINAILERERLRANGRQLSMLVTDQGMFLAWTDHSATPAPGSVRRQDGHAKVAAALKLRTK